MENELIPIELFCTHYRIEQTFVETMRERGLIEVRVVKESLFIPREELDRLERLRRLHFELEIHVDNLDLIVDLLTKLEALQEENRKLRRMSNE